MSGRVLMTEAATVFYTVFIDCDGEVDWCLPGDECLWDIAVVLERDVPELLLCEYLDAYG